MSLGTHFGLRNFYLWVLSVQEWGQRIELLVEFQSPILHLFSSFLFPEQIIETSIQD